MESIFLLDEGDRSDFLGRMIMSFGCSYICLWSYYPQPSNCLLFLDGIFQEISTQQPSSSSGSPARTFFNAYRELVHFVDNGRIPGFAFKNNLPYLELKLHDLQRLYSSEVQLHFYRAAGINTIVFMACSTGEIELGMSNESPVDLEMQIKNMISRELASLVLPQPTDQNQSSSSFRSLSFDSSEYSPLQFNFPTTSLVQEQPTQEALIQESLIESNLKSVPFSTPSVSTPYHHHVIRDLSQRGNFPTIESTDAAITKAILAVLSSSTHSPQHNLSNLPPVSHVSHDPASLQRNLDLRRRQEMQIQENRPTNAQLHHMMSERKRREKLNESFQILRSFLPLGSKKDKATILSSTIEYLTSLKSQVEQLKKANQLLEAQLSGPEFEARDDGSSSAQERVHVEINHLSDASTSQSRIMDLRVTLQGECNMLHCLVRILELLKHQRNVTLLSIESSTRIVGSASVNGVALRMKIEGDEFDEASFREAVRRVFDDDSAP